MHRYRLPGSLPYKDDLREGWPFQGEDDWPARDAVTWALALVALMCVLAVWMWL